MKGVLPERIRVRRDKIGFGTPEAEWFRTAKFRELVYDFIVSSSFRNRGIFEVGKVRSLYSQHVERRIDISQEIWKWISLELWFREFIDAQKHIAN